MADINAVLNSVPPVKYGGEKWEPSKTVKPRKRTTNAVKELVAVDLVSQTFLTEQGKSGQLCDLISNLHTLKQERIFVCRQMAEFVSMCQEHYSDHKHFQFFCTPFERQIWSLANHTREKELGKGHRHSKWKNRTIVSRFGFNWAKSPRKSRNIYHLCLDPVTFADRALKRDPTTLPELLRWSNDLRTYCQGELLAIRPTQGGIGRQYLKDPRFYDVPRRKVPRFINDNARSAIGRITIGIHARTDRTYQATYIDQHAAHHYQVQHTKLPDSNHIVARGNYKSLQNVWKADPKRIRSFTDSFHGLLLVTSTYSPMGGQWVPSYLDSYRSDTPLYVFTNELDLLYSVGVKVTGIIAAWGTCHVDKGMPAIGRHHSRITDTVDYDWIKPLLLSTYGTLATRPKLQSFGFGKSDSRNSEKVSLPAGGRTLDCFLHRTKKESEPTTNNVIHRGMIEAATQAETIMYANWLQSKGYRVLAVRVDCVIVEDDADLPPVPLLEPWRVVSKLTNLQFYSESAFASVEMNRGVTTKDVILKHAKGGGAAKIGNSQTRMERKINVWEAFQRAGNTRNYQRGNDGAVYRISDGKQVRPARR